MLTCDPTLLLISTGQQWVTPYLPCCMTGFSCWRVRSPGKVFSTRIHPPFPLTHLHRWVSGVWCATDGQLGRNGPAWLSAWLHGIGCFILLMSRRWSHPIIPSPPFEFLVKPCHQVPKSSRFALVWWQWMLGMTFWSTQQAMCTSRLGVLSSDQNCLRLHETFPINAKKQQADLRKAFILLWVQLPNCLRYKLIHIKLAIIHLLYFCILIWLKNILPDVSLTNIHWMVSNGCVWYLEIRVLNVAMHLKSDWFHCMYLI